MGHRNNRERVVIPWRQVTRGNWSSRQEGEIKIEVNKKKNTYIYFYISPISWLEKTNFRQGLKKTCSSSFSQKLSINIYVKLGRIFNLLKWTTRSSTKILCLRVNFNVFPSLKGTWKRALWGHASLKSRDVVLVFHMRSEFVYDQFTISTHSS